jgi:LytS/YehU family sensor histidine kinase
MSPSVIFIVYLYHGFNILGYNITLDDSIKCLLVGFAVNLIFVTLWEATYMMERMRESHSEKEMLQQLSVNQEFESLKSQVNPHFLFNCFNTLSSLITEDRQQAEVFLNELSKVYRYLLKNNRDGMSSVENELKFIHSYYRLLRTRHGSALQLNTEIDKRYYPYLLPSLSLQLLVENAVKHNVVSKHQPLIIEIFTTAGNKLVVNNNLQRKQSKVTSTKIGLENLRAKYQLLKQTDFQVMEDRKNYTVVLPLIWNNAAEHRIVEATEKVR